MPGVYDIGNNSLQMQPYVDIEGSGENVTTISGTPTFTSGWPPNVGVLMGANNAELRFLTVRNIGTLGNEAIVNISSFPSLLNVTTEASVGILNCGISNHPGTAPVMTNVMAIASGGDNSVAVSNWGGNLNQSSPKITNLIASATGGDYQYCRNENFSSAPIMSNVSVISAGNGTNWGMYNSGSEISVKNSKVSASGGTNAYGIVNSVALSGSYFENVIVSASSATNNYMLHNSMASPNAGFFTIFKDLSVTASGGTNTYGIYNRYSFYQIINTTISGMNGSGSNYGIYNDPNDNIMPSSFVIAIDGSSIAGGTNSINNNLLNHLKIGSSKLIGAVNAVGTYNCINDYDGTTYTALNNTCQ
jgi:hypothetical protein